MIKQSAQQQVRVRENVRGGEGMLTFHDFLLPEESFGAGKLFSRTVIPAGASIGLHRHEGEFEAYHVLSGVVDVFDGGAWQTLKQHDTHICASGESHALRNTSEAQAEVLMLILMDQTARG